MEDAKHNTKRKKNKSKKNHKSQRYSSKHSNCYDKTETIWKRKKSRHRRRHSSGEDDSASTDFLIKLEKERLEMKERHKIEKERLKLTETAEEKRARRILKRQLKSSRGEDIQLLGWNGESIQYTNDDNPFGDSNLMSSFRWNKKLEQEGLEKASTAQLKQMDQRRRREQQEELSKVKLSRLKREKEREEQRSLIELEERAKENQKFSQWQKNEDDFHLQQVKLRSNIRIQDGRAKPIDLLAKYISAEDEISALEMHEPYTYLNGLTIQDLEDLIADIRVYDKIYGEKNRDFWSDITVIVSDELNKLRKSTFCRSGYEEAAARRQGINKAVIDDVHLIFADKSASDLVALQKAIESKLCLSGAGIDISYWESLLSHLKAHLARARLRDKHSENLKKKLAVLKAEQHSECVVNHAGSEADIHLNNENSDDVVNMDLNPRHTDYISGCYSPFYLCDEDLEPGTLVVDEKEDADRRADDLLRSQRGATVENVLNAEEKALEREARKGMSNDEVSFAVEASLQPRVYEWSDKYRPRKPRYFNRVHTGFEWNKYNQTHYDIDNPPPKIVQGYKFNLFYPDLIDKRATPQYTLTPCEDNSDFAILRIHTGPPYEDIAFKIVNREWEFGYKRGFRCQFQNNIFQIWFHFKRLRYRR